MPASPAGISMSGKLKDTYRTVFRDNPTTDSPRLLHVLTGYIRLFRTRSGILPQDIQILFIRKHPVSERIRSLFQYSDTDQFGYRTGCGVITYTQRS